jgi:RNA polymerase sigma factor (sigma-70 family)
MLEYETETFLAARDGDSLAFSQLVEYWTPFLIPLVRKWQSSRVSPEDIIQELWLKILRLEHLKQIRNPDCFPGWLKITAKRLAWTIARKDAYRTTLSYDEDKDELASREHADSMEKQDEIAAIEKILARVPEVYRELLKDRFYGGMSLKQLAKNSSVPVGTIKSRMNRALTLARKERPVQVA